MIDTNLTKDLVILCSGNGGNTKNNVIEYLKNYGYT